VTITERTFDTSADELFAILIDPETYPDWLVGTKKMRDVSANWPVPGSTFTHVVGFGPLALTDRTTLREIDPPWSLELFVRARPALEAVVRFELEAEGTATRLRMTEHMAGLFKLIAPVAEPLIRARNERSLQRLADVVRRGHRATI
jgi:uncharacterized protein YndB with AHSA1/START domain